MRTQALFALCLTAASALVVTGCATKQEAAEQRAQQEAADVTVSEARETASEVSAEPLPVPEPQPAEPKAEARPVAHPKPVPYTVTAGDSVSALAVRFGVRQPDILALNPELRANPGRLRIGQKVMLPPGTDISKKPVPRKAAQPKAAPAGAVVYTVKAGDVLGGIAARHGVTVKAIKEANGLKKDFITVGQKLTIPGAKKTPKAEPKAAKPVAKPTSPKAKPAEPKAEAPKAEPKAAPAEGGQPAQEPEVVVPAPDGEQSGEEALPPPPPAQEAGAKVAAPVAATRDYVVQPGEDLVSVALRWGVSLPALRAANGIDEAAGNTVAPGTTLKVPVAAE